MYSNAEQSPKCHFKSCILCLSWQISYTFLRIYKQCRLSQINRSGCFLFFGHCCLLKKKNPKKHKHMEAITKERKLKQQDVLAFLIVVMQLHERQAGRLEMLSHRQQTGILLQGETKYRTKIVQCIYCIRFCNCSSFTFSQKIPS